MFIPHSPFGLVQNPFKTSPTTVRVEKKIMCQISHHKLSLEWCKTIRRSRRDPRTWSFALTSSSNLRLSEPRSWGHRHKPTMTGDGSNPMVNILGMVDETGFTTFKMAKPPALPLRSEVEINILHLSLSLSVPRQLDHLHLHLLQTGRRSSPATNSPKEAWGAKKWYASPHENGVVNTIEMRKI